MTEAIFKDVVHHFCEVVGLAQTPELQQERRLLIDGLSVELSQKYEAETLDISIDLGAVPSGREEPVYRTLLEMNAVASASRAGQIGLHAGTGHVVFNASMPLTTSSTGEDLVDLVDRVIGQAQYLRDAALQP